MPPITKTEMEKKIKELEDKVAEMQDELNKLKQVKTDKPKKWKPEMDNIYWYINQGGNIDWAYWYNDEVDNWHYLISNCFKTKEEAEEYKKKLEIQARFKNFVEERSEELDWNDEEQPKYFLSYGYNCDKYTNHKIEILKNFYQKHQGIIYASSEQILKDAIAEIGEDNIKKYVLEIEQVEKGE